MGVGSCSCSQESNCVVVCFMCFLAVAKRILTLFFFMFGKTSGLRLGITFGLIKLAGQASARFGAFLSSSVPCCIFCTTGVSLQGTRKLHSLSISLCIRGTKWGKKNTTKQPKSKPITKFSSELNI